MPTTERYKAPLFFQNLNKETPEREGQAQEAGIRAEASETANELEPERSMEQEFYEGYESSKEDAEAIKTGRRVSPGPTYSKQEPHKSAEGGCETR
ncbi:hypothetical protein NDU88_005091 [Pleurodeles waltl]|uniref:Uncharacterized protein n=1 Tax=Pleurodeles waltl TaxID=8319 RepID=A0AAV7SKU9_PLEWA|nr:hypothetical protein NDU88_005091 [Pleurodeles waltl]